MAGARLGRHTSMGDSECAFLQNLGPQKGSEGSRDEVLFGLGVGFGMGLKCFIGTQPVA